MAYISLDLKYRPQTFDEIVGQPHVAQTLKNAIEGGRVAHAYLFAGPRGTGKTTTARILAKALNCEKGPTAEPCGECVSCVGIRQGRAMDVIEIDAASHTGVDDVRDLREKVKFTPASARAKVYILDEAHMLSKGAFNALLKTIEEPPPHAFFVLATTEPHRIPATIHSRCQRFEFRAISIGDIRDRLAEVARAEGFRADKVALETIASAARGAMRDALSILDQVVAFAGPDFSVSQVASVLGATGRDVLIALADLIIQSDYGACFGAVQDAVDSGKDLQQLLADLTLHFRNLLLLSLGVEDVALLDIAESERPMLKQQADRLGPERARQVISILTDAQRDMRWNAQHRLVLEVALCHAATQAAAASPAAPAPVAREEPAPVQQSAAPAVPPPPPEGPLDLEVIRARWDVVKAALRGAELGASIVACLEGAPPPVAFADGVVTLRFSLEFHCEQVATRYRRTVEETLATVFGQPLKLRCELAAPDAEQPDLFDARPTAQDAPPPVPETPSPPSAAKAADPESDAVDLVLKLFPGSEEVAQ
jgi:DNA polymerase-3 subunit gamma/tau